MASDTELAGADALEIMRQWQWIGGDPDGNTWPVQLELSLAINRLAMEGISRPQDTVLALLCSGDLLATGDYKWRKYQGGDYFQLEGCGAPIKPNRWQDLARLIESERRAYYDFMQFDQVELVQLAHQSCDPYEWAFANDRFNTSVCPPDTPISDPSYLEEFYSAWEICVAPALLPCDLLDAEPEPELPAPNKGGAPRKWDWDGAILHLAALAHHGANGLFRQDGGDPNQSDIARHLQAWFIDTCKNSPENSQLREYGKRFVTELNALKLRDAKNPARGE